MKKLLLVQPTTKSTLDFVNYSDSVLKAVNPLLPESRLKKYLAGKKAVNIPTLSLMILSALTPRDQFEVEFVDEKIEPIDYDCKVDLVAITSNTTIVKRAYEIAKKFRERKVKVVLGGVHASVLPEEALQHVDAVVIEEAEYIWQKMLTDFLRGNLEGKYQADKYLDMERDYTIPDDSILKKEHYIADTSIELSRGCPYNCSFCSNPIIYGNGYRTRDLEQVISQIEQTESDYLFFADDNIAGKPKYAKELLTKLKRLNKRWIGNASVSLSKNPELTDLVIESGCKFLIVGFESTSKKVLEQIKKKQNFGNDYGKFVRYLQNNGVMVTSCFILGLVLTPYPGTPLFKEFEEKGRLLHQDWEKYNVRGGVPVFSGNDHDPEYLSCLEETVKTNGVYYFFRQLQKDPKMIERFVD